MEKFDDRIIKIMCVLKDFEMCIENENNPIRPLSSKTPGENDNLIWYDDRNPLYIADPNDPEDTSEYPIVRKFNGIREAGAYYTQSYFGTDTAPFVSIDQQGTGAVEWDFEDIWLALDEDGSLEWGDD